MIEINRSSMKMDPYHKAQARLSAINRHLTSSAQAAAVLQQTSPSFKYTLDSPDSPFTLQDRKFYEENGYFVVKNLFSQEELKIYADRFQEICEGKVKVPGMIMMRDVAIAKSEFVPGQKSVTKIQDYQNDDVMFQYARNEEMLRYVEPIVGENIAAMHTMLINKPPDPGSKSSRHPLHQDLHYFPFRPADRIVASWTAMEHVHRQNGCLVVIPGSHKEGRLRLHKYPDWKGGVNKYYHGIQDYNPDEKLTYLEMQAGDTVFFHPLLVHGSGTNTTEGFRKAISCHYASSDCYIIDEQGTEHEELSRELKEEYRKKFGDQVDNIKMGDAWRLKGRMVKGEQTNLGVGY